LKGVGNALLVSAAEAWEQQYRATISCSSILPREIFRSKPFIGKS
jgi:hypothetical protein